MRARSVSFGFVGFAGSSGVPSRRSPITCSRTERGLDGEIVILGKSFAFRHGQDIARRRGRHQASGFQKTPLPTVSCAALATAVTETCGTSSPPSLFSFRDSGCYRLPATRFLIGATNASQVNLKAFEPQRRRERRGGSGKVRTSQRSRQPFSSPRTLRLCGEIFLLQNVEQNSRFCPVRLTLAVLVNPCERQLARE